MFAILILSGAAHEKIWTLTHVEWNYKPLLFYEQVVFFNLLMIIIILFCGCLNSVNGGVLNISFVWIDKRRRTQVQVLYEYYVTEELIVIYKLGRGVKTWLYTASQDCFLLQKVEYILKVSVSIQVLGDLIHAEEETLSSHKWIAGFPF